MECSQSIPQAASQTKPGGDQIFSQTTLKLLDTDPVVRSDRGSIFVFGWPQQGVDLVARIRGRERDGAMPQIE